MARPRAPFALRRPVSPHSTIYPRLRPDRLAAGAVVVLLVLYIGTQLAHNQGLGWARVGEYLFYPKIIRGIGITLLLTLIAMVGGVLGGFLLVMAIRSGNRVLSGLGAVYIWVVRGIPLLVQIIFWFNIAIVVPRLAVGVPGSTPWYEWDTNDIMSGLTAAIVALVLNEAAYMAEIIRGSLAAVPAGQTQAALALGLTRGRALRRVVFPQTVKVLIPPTGNQLIGMIKNTSLVSAVGGGDLMTNVQYVYGANFAVVPLLLVACFWYLAITSVLSVLQLWVERRLGSGSRVREADDVPAGAADAAAQAADAAEREEVAR